MKYSLTNLPDMPAMLADRVGQIPDGKVSTYGAIAASLGNVIAARWVATFLLHDPRAEGCAGHRVIRADGSLGLHFRGDAGEKAQLLREEGVAVTTTGVSLEHHLFTDFRGERPLEDLRQQQTEVRKSIKLTNHCPRPRLIGGIDISYLSSELGTAAFVLCDANTGERVWCTTLTGPIRFPYISSYLAYRELPLALQVISQAKDEGYSADVLLVDGSGILHPRGVGVASQLGVAVDVPTIGVTKKKLAGKLDCDEVGVGQPVAIREGRRRIGWAMRPRPTSKKLIYVSPGHGVTVDSAKRIVQRLLSGRALPEPIYWADRLSRQEVKHQQATTTA